MNAYTKHFLQISLWPSALSIGIIMVTGTFGNAIVIAVCHKHFRKTLPWAIIYALAILDFLSCIIVQPLDLAALLNYTTYPSNLMCKMKEFFDRVLQTSSGFLLVLIALHRYEKIWQPSKRVVLLKRVKKLVLGIVIVMTLTSTPTLYTHGLVEADMEFVDGKVVLTMPGTNTSLSAEKREASAKGYFCLALDKRPRLNLTPIHLFFSLILHGVIAALLFFFYIRVIVQIISFQRHRDLDPQKDDTDVRASASTKRVLSPSDSSIVVIKVMDIQGGAKNEHNDRRRSRLSSMLSRHNSDNKCCAKNNSNSNWSREGNLTIVRESWDMPEDSQKKSPICEIIQNESFYFDGDEHDTSHLSTRRVRSDPSISFFYHDTERSRHRREKTTVRETNFRQDVLDKIGSPPTTINASRCIREESKAEYSGLPGKTSGDSNESCVSNDSREHITQLQKSCNHRHWSNVEPRCCQPTNSNIEANSRSPVLVESNERSTTASSSILNLDFNNNNNSEIPNASEKDKRDENTQVNNNVTEPGLLSKIQSKQTVQEPSPALEQNQSKLQTGVGSEPAELQNSTQKSAQQRRRSKKSVGPKSPEIKDQNKTMNYNKKANIIQKIDQPATAQQSGTEETLIHAYRTSALLFFIALIFFGTHVMYWVYIFINWDKLHMDKSEQLFGNLMVRAPYLLCALNPILYAFLNEKFYKAFKVWAAKFRERCCCCCIKKKPVKGKGHKN